MQNATSLFYALIHMALARNILVSVIYAKMKKKKNYKLIIYAELMEKGTVAVPPNFSLRAIETVSTNISFTLFIS